MENRSACRLSGEEALQSLADFAKVAASGVECETISTALRLVCEMFDGEGAILWLLNEEVGVLEQKKVANMRESRSKAFEQLSSEKLLRFGDSLAGRAWAEGEPILFEQPPMYAQVPEPGAPSSSANTKSEPIRTLAFPLFGGGTISGIIAVIGTSINDIDELAEEVISILGTGFGGLLYAITAVERLRLLKDQIQKLTTQVRVQDLDMQAAKRRLSAEFEKSVQTARFHSQFLKKVSNEIRTPLNGITGIVELLLRTNMDETQREYADIIRESASVLLTVVEQLIDFSNTETMFFAPTEPMPLTTASEGEKQTTDAAETNTQEQKNEEQYLAQARVLVVTGIIGSAENVEAYASASGIACESTSRGHSALTLMRQALRAEAPFDVVFVESVLPDMDAFEFARIVRHEKYLSSTKLILVSSFSSSPQSDQTMRAGFSAHIAKPTKQSQVINVLMAVLEGSAYIQEAAESPMLRMTPAAVTGKPMILVAEDNPVNQKVALLQLKELGFYAKVVTNGEEAVESVKEGIYDAVLMDLQMPQVDGFNATREIRKWEEKTGTHIPIIAMTAQAMAADRDKALTAGMDDYISKPVTYDKLSSVLFNWTEGSDSHAHESMTFAPQEVTQMQFSPESNPQPEGQQAPVGGPIDVSSLLEMLGPEETDEILKLFLESSENLVGKINTACQSQDPKLLKEAAHELKGACSSVGAAQMAETCQKIEAALKESDWAQMPSLQNGLSSSFADTKTYINGRLA